MGHLKSRTALLLVVAVVYSLAGAALVWLAHGQLRGQALWEAQAKARLMLEHNLAIHTYFSHQLKPRVFELADGAVPPGYFEPAWMSSTYAIREIEQYAKQLSEDRYYYKECAINARNPGNEADDYERAFLRELQSDPKLEFRQAIRVLDGQPYLTVLRRGEVMEQSCLRCHTTPEMAPRDMVELYGDQRSFGRQEGEVVSAVSMRVPLAAAHAEADRFAAKLSLMLLAVLGISLLALFFFSRRFLLQPLEAMEAQARSIGQGPENLGRQIPLDFPGEWNQLAQSFNQMSSRLKASHDQLGERVRQRTADLEKALAEVRQISGLLPICAHCKKIRDDQGYWRQLEIYIQERSEAEFSHGICPDCARQLYADLDDLETLTGPKK